MLYNAYADEKNVVYFLYLKNILSEVNRVNLSFESDTADPSKLVEGLIFLIKSLLEQILITTKQHDPFTCNIDENLDPNPYLGYEAEKKLRELNLNETEINVIKSRCSKFAVKLVTEIRLRVPENVKMSIFSATNALNATKDSIIELLQCFKLIQMVLVELNLNGKL